MLVTNCWPWVPKVWVAPQIAHSVDGGHLGMDIAYPNIKEYIASTFKL